MTNLAHGVPTDKMCQTHIGSAHVESHQEMANIIKGNWSSTLGHIRANEVDPTRLRQRHNELAQHLNHNPDTKWKPQEYDDIIGIDVELMTGVPQAAMDLYQINVFRCKPCDCFHEEAEK